jgi:pilus assembly protein CpaF
MFTNRPAASSSKNTSSLNVATQPARQDSSTALTADSYHIRERVQRKLLAEVDGDSNPAQNPQMQQMIETSFNQVLVEENLLYTRATRAKLLEWVVADILGYGPLEPLLNEASITEIMVNGPKTVYVEKHGTIEMTDVIFESNEHLMRIIDRIVAPIGRRVDEASPMVDARLPNGYRINATIPPLSLEGPILTIRKFAQTPYSVQDLVGIGTLTPSLVEFLRACVEARVNIIISGGTGSGKTTLLNAISTFIHANERVITIEDTAELQLRQAHVVRLEKRPPNVEGKGEITIRQLVINALRMRPDRIIVGESRGGEALDMLQAMNTGHDGSMTTVHANSPRDTLRRIETMVLMAGMDLPLRAIREQIASAVNLVLQVERLRDGTRRVTAVSEVQGLEGDAILMQDIFVFEQTGFQNGRVVGRLKANGLRPLFAEKFTAMGIQVPANIFDRGEVL